MANLKQLFLLRKGGDDVPQGGISSNQPITNIDNSPQPSTSNVSTQTYKQLGLIMAGACNGEVSALATQLNSAVQRIKNHQSKDDLLQTKSKHKIAREIADIEGRVNKKDELIKLHQSKIEHQQAEISDIDKQIAYVKSHPEEFGTDPMSKVGLWISGIILAFLTLYLFVFYSSASYSAFFKEFSSGNDTVITQAIFDAQALSKATDMGITALIFILLIPFVFLGLGFLIHKFQEGKNMAGHLKAAAIIAITFIYDAFLAYEITEKIHNIKSEGSFEESVEYSFSLAMTSVNFWVIIFSGFVVYVIWGFVFDSAMHSYQSLDNVQRELNKLAKIKDGLQASVTSEKHEIVELQKKQASLRAGIDALKVKMNTIMIDTVMLSHELANFFDGWLIFVANNTDTDTREHVLVYEQFKKENQIQ